MADYSRQLPLPICNISHWTSYSSRSRRQWLKLQWCLFYQVHFIIRRGILVIIMSYPLQQQHVQSKGILSPSPSIPYSVDCVCDSLARSIEKGESSHQDSRQREPTRSLRSCWRLPPQYLTHSVDAWPLNKPRLVSTVSDKGERVNEPTKNSRSFVCGSTDWLRLFQSQ